MDPQLVDRLSRLESLIERLKDRGSTATVDSSLPVVPDPQDTSRGREAVHTAGGAGVAEAEQNTVDDHDHQDELHGISETPISTEASFDSELSIDQQMGHLMINDTRSSYVSNVLWASLSKEVGRPIAFPIPCA